MTECKFTDEEVIKAFECCRKDTPKDCDACPYVDIDTKTYCVNEMIKDALDLINRKNAEIEQYRDYNAELQEKLGESRNEALTEYVTELEKRLIAGGLGIAFVRSQMYKLLKEMTEENNGQKP